VSLIRQRTESVSVINRVRSDSNRTGTQSSHEAVDESEFMNHPVEARARTAQLPPVMVSNIGQCAKSCCSFIAQSKKIDDHPLSGLAFEQDCIITSCLEGMKSPIVNVMFAKIRLMIRTC
jgi:hypothetical protein